MVKLCCSKNSHANSENQIKMKKYRISDIYLFYECIILDTAQVMINNVLCELKVDLGFFF